MGSRGCTRSVPRLVPRDDGLRGSVPLPRALREPLPARPAGEVQGLGARARLVARAPADPDGGLPARLLGSPQGPAGRDRALLAVPARRAPGVGLLRDLAPVRVA